MDGRSSWAQDRCRSMRQTRADLEAEVPFINGLKLSKTFVRKIKQHRDLLYCKDLHTYLKTIIMIC